MRNGNPSSRQIARYRRKVQAAIRSIERASERVLSDGRPMPPGHPDRKRPPMSKRAAKALLMGLYPRRHRFEITGTQAWSLLAESRSA